MRTQIPAYVIAVLSEVVPESQTHTQLNALLMHAGAPGDPPAGNKEFKVQEWLRRVNRDQTLIPLEVLGRLIEPYMEPHVDDYEPANERKLERKAKIEQVLARAGFQYMAGGRVLSGATLPSRSLKEIISGLDLPSVNEEFERALATVERSPREAVSAACNILEAICKTYIEDEGLEMPHKQDLQGVWAVVRKDLGFDPSLIEDQDLQQILSGIIGAVSGIAALRTHASAAHAPGRRRYKLQPRHARLAVHGAHTVAAFILESWQHRKAKTKMS
jgi:hypothetical protein